MRGLLVRTRQHPQNVIPSLLPIKINGLVILKQEPVVELGKIRCAVLDQTAEYTADINMVKVGRQILGV